jgi:hypothetical protein
VEAHCSLYSFSTVSRLYVVHSETRKQKRGDQKKARVTTRKRDETRRISVISLSEVYPIPERYRVGAFARNLLNQLTYFN